MPRARVRLLIVILLACAALYLVGNRRVGLWDRDEPRYCQTSRQFLQSGDWVVPVLLDKVRTAKPVFIYWCQAVSMKAWGVDPINSPVQNIVYAARFPSAVAMLLTLGIVGTVITRTVGATRAAWTVFVLGTAGLTIAAAKMCITDSVLLLFITVAQLCLAAIYLGNRSLGVSLAMWIAFGLACLTKGPVVLGVQLTTMLVLSLLDVWEIKKGTGTVSSRRWTHAFAWWKQTRPLSGVAIVAAVVAPWLWMIEQRSPGFLHTTISHDVVTRTLKPLEGHKGPPGFYLLTVWATYFPWSLLLPTVATVAFKHRNLPHVRFALAAVIGPWLMMEFVQTKLVHYVMPAFPALAFLTGDTLVRCIRKQHDDLHRPIMRGVAGIWAALVIGAGILPWLVMRRFDHPSILTVVAAAFSVAGIVYAVVVFLQFQRQRIPHAALAMGGGMIVVIAIFYGLWLPEARFLWIPSQVADILNAHGATGQGDVVMIDYKEDSVPVYHNGNSIRARDDDFLAVTPPGQWPTWVVLTSEIRDNPKWLPPARRELLEVVGSVKGLAYADGGRTVEVLVARKKQP